MIPYLVAFLAVNLWHEAALRLWAIPFSRLDPAGRARRFNTLIRQWGVSLFLLTRWVFGFRLVVEGRVPDGRHVIVSNHQSTADIAILTWVFRRANCKFVVKRSLARFLPSVSTAVRHGGFGIIERRASRDDLRALRAMAEELEAWDASVILFAEGTRSRDGSVLPYHRAGARVAARASGLPLLPVAIDGTWEASDLLTFGSGMPGRTFKVTIGEPVGADAQRRFDDTLEAIRSWTVDAIERARLAGETTSPPDWRPGLTGRSAEGSDAAKPRSRTS